jgi:hypothetical protein
MVLFGGSVSSHGRMVDTGSDYFAEKRAHRIAYFLLAAAAFAVTIGAVMITATTADLHQTILSEKEVHDLHLANSLKDALTKGPDPSVPASDNSDSDIHLGAKDAAMINLDEARKQAEKRVLMIAARHKLDTTHDEELILKQRLDADTRYCKSKFIAWHQLPI